MNQITIPTEPEENAQKHNRLPPKEKDVQLTALIQINELEASRQPDMLIEHFKKIQDRFGHLNARHLTTLAKEIGMREKEMFEVASFFDYFDSDKGNQTKPSTLTVRICTGLPCELNGALKTLGKLSSMLAPEVRVIATPCVGRCADAPVAIAGDYPVTHSTCEKIVQAIDRGLIHPIKNGYIDFYSYRAQGGYTLLKSCNDGSKDRETIITTIEDSRLRGMSNVGFSVGRKWRIIRDSVGPRQLVVNVDTDEPGAFKERAYLEADPHRFLEGMLIAAWAIQANKIQIYLPDEYQTCRAVLLCEIQKIQNNPPIPKLPVLILKSSRVCINQEESKNVDIVEDKQDLPRLQSTHPTQYGLFGCKSLEQNFGTLYWIRDILEKGAAWFSSQGMHGRTGLRFYSVAGRIKKPGIKIAPSGITIQQLIDDYCGGMLAGHTFKAYLPGGTAEKIMPASLNNIPLDPDALQPYGCAIGSTAIVVLSTHDHIVSQE